MMTVNANTETYKCLPQIVITNELAYTDCRDQMKSSQLDPRDSYVMLQKVLNRVYSICIQLHIVFAYSISTFAYSIPRSLWISSYRHLHFCFIRTGQKQSIRISFPFLLYVEGLHSLAMCRFYFLYPLVSHRPLIVVNLEILNFASYIFLSTRSFREL